MKRLEATVGRYKLIAGLLHDEGVAHAYPSRDGKQQAHPRKQFGPIASAEGPTAEAAMANLKALLDTREADAKSARRYDEYLKFHVPTEAEYFEAYDVLVLTDAELKMLRAHAQAGEQGLTAVQIARAGGYRNRASAGALDGAVGRKFQTFLGLETPRPELREEDVATGVLATAGAAREDGEKFVWIMHPELRAALQGQSRH